jgi:hypothetical protein
MTFTPDDQWGTEKILIQVAIFVVEIRNCHHRNTIPMHYRSANVSVRHVLRKVDFMVEVTWSEGQGRKVLRPVSVDPLSVSSAKGSKMQTLFHSATSTRHSMLSGVAQGGLVALVLLSLHLMWKTCPHLPTTSNWLSKRITRPSWLRHATRRYFSATCRHLPTVFSSGYETDARPLMSPWIPRCSSLWPQDTFKGSSQHSSLEGQSR